MSGLSLLELILHVDTFLLNFIDRYGLLVYILVFAVVFAETGIFAPLPGDSLIFACAAFAAAGSLDIWIVMLLCVAAGLSGDTLNYYLGHAVGKRIYARAHGRFIKKENIDKAQAFYEKHGGKAIIFSRFIPIIRQFTPFVAGIGRMTFRRFMRFNVIGVFCWVLIASTLGYFFGNLPAVRDNFSTVILAIIVISLLPAVIGYLKPKLKKKKPDAM